MFVFRAWPIQLILSFSVNIIFFPWISTLLLKGSLPLWPCASPSRGLKGGSALSPFLWWNDKASVILDPIKWRINPVRSASVCAVMGIVGRKCRLSIQEAGFHSSCMKPSLRQECCGPPDSSSHQPHPAWSAVKDYGSCSPATAGGPQVPHPCRSGLNEPLLTQQSMYVDKTGLHFRALWASLI